MSHLLARRPVEPVSDRRAAMRDEVTRRNILALLEHAEWPCQGGNGAAGEGQDQGSWMRFLSVHFALMMPLAPQVR